MKHQNFFTCTDCGTGENVDKDTLLCRDCEEVYQDEEDAYREEEII